MSDFSFMKVSYVGNVEVRLWKEDIGRIIDGEILSGHPFGLYSKRFVEVNVFASDERFCSSGGLAEGFDEDGFQGWVLEKPRRLVQLAFPWGNGEAVIDYGTLDIKMSRPALVGLVGSERTLRGGGGCVCGMARGAGSGHIIDRLHIYFYCLHSFIK